MTDIVDRFTGSHRFLSNFFTSKVIFEKKTYRSAEHAFQAAKSERPEVRVRIANLKTAGEAKRAGRSVVLRPGWEGMKSDVMREVLRSKFSDSRLKQMLLDTGDAQLIEGNDWGDVWWGMCRGVGKNMLGKILMEIRKELQ